MLRILGRITVDGTKAVVERLASTNALPGGEIFQTGLKRRIPDVDCWRYESPLYRFHNGEKLDKELRGFILANARLGEALAESREGVQYAFLTLFPVGQSFEESLSSDLSPETVREIANLGVGFQINPEPIMPYAPFWVSRKRSRGQV